MSVSRCALRAKHASCHRPTAPIERRPPAQRLRAALCARRGAGAERSVRGALGLCAWPHGQPCSDRRGPWRTVAPHGYPAGDRWGWPFWGAGTMSDGLSRPGGSLSVGFQWAEWVRLHGTHRSGRLGSLQRSRGVRGCAPGSIERARAVKDQRVDSTRLEDLGVGP